MDYLLHIATLVCIFGILSISLELLAGQAGLLSIAQAAFMAVGAYVFSISLLTLGLPFLLAVPAAVLVGALSSLLISLPALRLRGDFFAMATFMFQVVAFGILNNWTSVTGGAFGIRGIPRPGFTELSGANSWAFFVCAAVVLVLAYWTGKHVTSGGFGRILHAIREDENYALSLGKSTVKVKLQLVALSSALASLSGVLYATYFSYIDPNIFTFSESILVISMVAIGGAGNLKGAMLGALLLVLLPEALRFVGLPSTAAANLRQIIYGALLVVIMIFLPSGLVGKFKLGR